MARFLIRRILLGTFVMWLITLIVFGIFFLVPSNVARTIAGRNATPATIRLISNRLHLDQPWYQQYWHFLTRLLHGDLGHSYYHGQSVWSVITADAPVTLSLAAGAAVIWLVLGVANGVISAIRPRSLIDRGLTGFALFFYSMPTFVLGLGLIYFLSYKLTLAGLAWLPEGSYIPFSQSPGEWAKHLILPWLTVALVSAATYTRLTRASMLDVLGEDYIRTARAKGLRERRVILRHGLRSALTPVVTQFGIDLGTAVGGFIVTEQIFSLPGLGYDSVQAIVNQDLPIIIGIVLVASLAVIVANILVDIGYAILDPRVRLN
jgi:peptide/nickel transport system permease protein